jgi:hypothetical protein
MTTQKQEIFHEMQAALQDVVNWYGSPTQGDAPAIARAKQAPGLLADTSPRPTVTAPSSDRDRRNCQRIIRRRQLVGRQFSVVRCPRLKASAFRSVIEPPLDDSRGRVFARLVGRGEGRAR